MSVEHKVGLIPRGRKRIISGQISSRVWLHRHSPCTVVLAAAFPTQPALGAQGAKGRQAHSLLTTTWPGGGRVFPSHLKTPCLSRHGALCCHRRARLRDQSWSEWSVGSGSSGEGSCHTHTHFGLRLPRHHGHNFPKWACRHQPARQPEADVYFYLVKANKCHIQIPKLCVFKLQSPAGHLSLQF